MVDSFSAKVIAIVRRIPGGKVSTYGRVARMAGRPRAARQVVRILHTCSDKYNLPWHRVVNRFGKIPPRAGLDEAFQRSLLLDEGVIVKPGNLIDLDVYLWSDELG